MRSVLRRFPRRILLPLGVVLVAPALVAYHWSQLGWRDKHYNYPM